MRLNRDGDLYTAYKKLQNLPYILISDYSYPLLMTISNQTSFQYIRKVYHSIEINKVTITEIFKFCKNLVTKHQATRFCNSKNK